MRAFIGRVSQATSAWYNVRVSARFARQDYVEEAWRIVDPVLNDATPVYSDEPGTWGPREAHTIVAPDGGWFNPIVHQTVH